MRLQTLLKKYWWIILIVVLYFLYKRKNENITIKNTRPIPSEKNPLDLG